MLVFKSFVLHLLTHKYANRNQEEHTEQKTCHEALWVNNLADGGNLWESHWNEQNCWLQYVVL